MTDRVSDRAVYRRLLGYVVPHWAVFTLSVLGFIVYSVGNVLLADLTQFLLDSLGESTQLRIGMVARAAEFIWPINDQSKLDYARVAIPIAAVVIALGRALGYFFGTYFMNVVARSVVHTLRTELFDVFLTLPRSHHDAHTSGGLVSKLTFNVEQVSGAASDALKVILREGLTVVALVAYMLYLNWKLSLIFFAVAPVIGLVVTVVGRHFRRYSRRIQDSMGSVTQVSGETLMALDAIRVYSAQQQQSERFHEASKFNRNQSLKLAFVQAVSTPIIQTLLALALGAIFWFALDPNILAGFTAGSLVAFITAAAQVGKPVRTLSGVQSVVQRGLAAAEDVFVQLDATRESDNGEVPVERAAGNIVFAGVEFSYPDTAVAAIDAFDLTVRAGETLALVGRSGSGKSTLAQLLLRFYSPQKGHIRLDGVDINQYQLAAYRRQIAVVSQSVELFSDTVRHNIAFGEMANASESDIEQACRRAHAWEFIEQLPQGLDTMLGDGGAGLSGGQRQRLAIARAFLKDAPILILDEATSALDNESEQQVQRALEEISARRTTLVIAHRLSTIEKADRVAVLDGGRLMELGAHADLIARGGRYASLYRQGLGDVEQG